MSTLDELLPLLDDDVPQAPRRASDPRRWKVLVVDDDPEVLVATRLSLRGAEILGRPLELLEARSAQQARDLLTVTRDVAVILLDVVMESTDAGLRLVQVIREELGLADLRIILRTGEPGYAPEIAVISNYDVNDYKAKGELTQARLVTALTAALRSYAYITLIHEHRRGLEKIVHASAALLEQQSLAQFADGVLTQIAAVLQLPVSGLLCVQRGSPFTGGPREDCLYVLGAAGQLAPFVAQPLENLPRPDIIEAVHATMARQAHTFADDYTVLHLRNAAQEGAIYLETAQPLRFEDRQLVEVFAANISACFANVGLFERLQHGAHHDGLTGLVNRARFMEELDAPRAAGAELQMALVGIAGIPEVGAGLGLDVGDQALITLADRLSLHFPAPCRVARVADDCFGVAGPPAAVDPQRLVDLLAEPVVAGEHLIPLGFHLGVSRSNGAAEGGRTLIKRASMALQAARRGGRPEPVARFEPRMEEDTRQRLEIIRELRRDFRRSGLQLWYQPQIDLKTGRLVSMESLLRWPAETGFRHPPSVFVPLAESSGLIEEIGEWVLRQACTDLVRLREVCPGAPPRVAVNVSQLQFRSASFVGRVCRVLEEQAIGPEHLELEITESIAMDEPRVVIATLRALRELGVRLAIDDFGVGYSCLAYLRELPIHALKIDRSFVNEISGGDGILAEAILRLGRQLGLEVVAEGVETSEQEAFLAAHRCELVQGYRYARPMPLDALGAWVSAWERRGAAELAVG